MKKISVVITSAEIIGNNKDLLTQILLRIPTMPLLKFKCVSKQWLSLISSPDFCFSHTRYHRQTNGFLTPTALVLKWFYSSPSEFDVVPLKPNSKVPSFDYLGAPNINVLQSCYGLFLCASLEESRVYPFVDISTYFICNPTTKKFKELFFPTTPFPVFTSYVSLAFDPLKSPHYKIISIREVSLQPSKFELDVYSSETDSWSVGKVSFGLEKPIRFEDAIYCNGKIHWNSYWNESLYFDVENESLEPMPMPISTIDAPTGRKFFGEYQDVLYTAVTYDIRVCEELEVFEMASDYSHWLLKHRLFIGNLCKNFSQRRWDHYGPGFNDVCITRFEREADPKLVVWRENKVIFYDFEDGMWKSLYDVMPGIDIDSVYKNHRSKGLDYESIHAYQYFENLSYI